MDRCFRRGSAVLLLNGSGNRDERKFPDGDRFDVTRKIDHHLAFGYGLHFCLGAALARLEGRVALDEVLQRFPSWEVDWENAEAGPDLHGPGLGMPPGGLHLSRSTSPASPWPQPVKRGGGRGREPSSNEGD